MQNRCHISCGRVEAVRNLGRIDLSDFEAKCFNPTSHHPLHIIVSIISETSWWTDPGVSCLNKNKKPFPNTCLLAAKLSSSSFQAPAKSLSNCHQSFVQPPTTINNKQESLVRDIQIYKAKNAMLGPRSLKHVHQKFFSLFFD